MKKMPLEKREISTSRLVYGCMGLGGGWNHDSITKDDIVQAEKAIETALSIGITMFDHADIYKMGKSETVFGKVLKERPELRKKIVLQSKCGIRFPEGDAPQRYDFSKDHILQSVDGTLERLGVEYIDVLLLHRPDPLVEPEEVAIAFDVLYESGKVRHFGVSNMSAAQMRFLQKYSSYPIVVNQLEMSLKRLDWIEQGVLVNQQLGANVNFADGIIEHCRMEDIQIQAWGPLAKGMFTGGSLVNPSDTVLKTKEAVEKMASEKNTSAEAIVLAWLMRHPAMIQPVIGTANPERIRKCEDAVKQSEVMTREDWYTLYVAARGDKVP